MKGSVCLLGCLNSEMSVEGGCELRLIFYSTFLTREQFNSRELKYLARTADSFSTVIIARMSRRKWREIKQQPSRARSGKQISCCLVSLYILSKGPVYYMSANVGHFLMTPSPFCLDIIYGSPLEWSLCTRRVGWKGRNLGAHSREAPLRRAVDRTLYNWQQPLLTPPMHNQCFVVLLVKIYNFNWFKRYNLNWFIIIHVLGLPWYHKMRSFPV